MNHEERETNGDDDASVDVRTITPNLPRHVLRKLSAYVEIKSEENKDNLANSLRRLQELWEGEDWSLELRAVALLLADLIDQGWRVFSDEAALHLQPPGLRLAGETPEVAKERLRKALQTGRNRQLAEAGTQKFLRKMHSSVTGAKARGAISDIIDNGASLAAALKPFANLPPIEAADRLRHVVDPVVQICDENARCEYTGLRLIDIWRYFRHTWSLEYRSTPGRQMAVLIRNAARPKAPVIGIAMLASPVVRMRARDDWIGWNPEAFVARISSGEWDAEVALRAIAGRLERSIMEIRWDDLASPDEIAFPTERTVLRLEQRAAGAALARIRELEDAYREAEEANESLRSQRDATKRSPELMDWRAASEDMLFVRKRAETLGQLLDAKRTLQRLDWAKHGSALLEELLREPNGLRAINTCLVEVRKAGLSSQVADVSVCGAVAPYSQILGGKLVALLVTSNEVREGYRSRYAEQVSVISSQMAGQAIYRPAELKVLTTTSLYGNGSSQYNRLKLEAARFHQLEHDIVWKELAKTAGFGTVHLGATTARVLREVSERMYKARRINHRFGEGASPRLRQLREAVQALGIDPASVLHHATPRINYVCELHSRAREELMGFSPPTESRGESAAAISGVWRMRWLAKRIQSKEVLDALAQANAQSVADQLARGADLPSLFAEDEAVAQAQTTANG